MQFPNNTAWNPAQMYNNSGPSSSRSENSPGQPGPSNYRNQAAPAVPPHPQPMPHRSRSAGAPAPNPPPPVPPRPPSLTPGGFFLHGQTSAGNRAPDLFFEQPDYGFPRRSSDAASRSPLYALPGSHPRHPQSYMAGTVYSKPPPLPQKPVNASQVSSSILPKQHANSPSFPSPPTLPPKISLYPRSIPGPVSNLSPSENASTSAHSPVEDNDLALALAASASEATKWKQHPNEQDEDEELARALEESKSMALAADTHISPHIPLEVTPPDNPTSWAPSMPVPTHYRSLPTSPQPPYSGDSDVDPMDGSHWVSGSPQMLAAQVSDDEALARRLAAEGDEAQPSGEHHTSEQRVSSPEPPLYSPAVSNALDAPSPQPTYATSVFADHSVSPRPESVSLSRRDSVRSASSQKSVDSGGRSSLGLPSGSMSIPSTSPVIRPASADTSNLSVPSSSKSSGPGNLRPISSMSTLNPHDSSHGMGANHFVEKELLDGVSLGFTAPAISTMRTPMSGPMPNIITLPFGRSPPLHLQAPSWRHLLKLMARLSGTRIEPTLEAMAVAKGDLKLRTVVQFVKVHHSAMDWRMVLYLTIDHPVPPNAPNAWKYTNGDVSTLPWSYTLSGLPTLLRDGADSEMATYYTIPATTRTPHPTLPITFPNMAMYLQSALEDSRRAMNDSSSGLRKLAKYVDTYYANDHEVVGVEDETEVRRSFGGGLFKKVIKRGNKQPKGNRGGNEEVYEFVTPFVPDEWG